MQERSQPLQLKWSNIINQIYFLFRLAKKIFKGLYRCLEKTWLGLYCNVKHHSIQNTFYCGGAWLRPRVSDISVSIFRALFIELQINQY